MPKTIELDAINLKLIELREANYNRISSPRVGDYIVMKDKSLQRFSHEWEDGLQTTDGRFGCSFHMFSNGGVSFSGGLNPTVKFENIQLLSGDLHFGLFWMFDHDISGAGREINFSIAVRTYLEV
jgi:hypothetical protein